MSTFPIFGEPLQNAVEQMERIASGAERVALMADHHLGYSMPIGGVALYRDVVSPSGVGFDIACGNKAVKTNLTDDDVVPCIKGAMDAVFNEISFGVGRKNATPVDHQLFDDDPAWGIPAVKELEPLARGQLGTVGSGNHYVDIFLDEDLYVWVGVHFGSRGFGHKIATHFLKAAGGKDDIDAEPTLIAAQSDLGQEYIAAMNLAGRFAYAGRDYVCDYVVREILGGEIVEEVHNHHNFAWREEHFGEQYWVVRKGATPAFPGQRGFVGGSMGENSVILEGVDTELNREALRSTVHGAGRVMSRTEAAGKKRWKRVEPGKPKQLVQVKEGSTSREMMLDWVTGAGVELRGAGTDESPHCYKRLNDVLAAHGDSIRILHTLKPIGVAMAGIDEFDPYKD